VMSTLVQAEWGLILLPCDPSLRRGTGEPALPGAGECLSGDSKTRRTSCCGQKLAHVRSTRGAWPNAKCHPPHSCPGPPAQRHSPTPAATSAVAAPPARKRAASDPGEPNTTPAQQQSSLSAAPQSPALPRHWRTRLWDLSGVIAAAVVLVSGWMELIAGLSSGWDGPLRGGFWQYNVDRDLPAGTQRDMRDRLRAETEQLGRSRLEQLGIDTSTLLLAGMKIIRMFPLEGRQEVHYDVQKHYYAQRCYTVLMYLTSTLSTRMPWRTLAELRDTFTSGEEPPPAKVLQKVARKEFIAEPVQPGQLMTLRCDVPHWGDANPNATEPRFLVFMMFYTLGDPKPDTEEQRYPHGVED